MYVIEIDIGKKHLIRFIGIDQFDRSHKFIGAWPEIFYQNKKYKNYHKVDPRVDKIEIKELASEFAYETYRYNVNSVEGLKDLRFLKDMGCDYNKYNRLQTAKELLKSTDLENGALFHNTP